MINSVLTRSVLAVGLAQFALALTPALAQSGDKGSAKIICWKDKSGKVVGCGDRVPPEYQSSATKELDQRGVTRRTTESAEEAAKRRAKEQELAAQKAAEEKRLAEQRRQDSALLNTYANVQEIDAKRDREIKLVEHQISEYQISLKAAETRLKEAEARKPNPDTARAAAEIDGLKKRIAGKEKEKEALNQAFAAQKQRYQELRGPAQSATAPPPSPAPAPPAKK
jgi:hypothetical protein